MAKYLVRRLLLCLVTFIGITVIVYFMASLAPGSPLDAMLAEPGMSLEEQERLAAQWGLDKPVVVQYFSWFGQMIQGNLGYSYRTSQKVTGMVLDALGPTVLLTFSSLFLAYLIAIPIGIRSARKPYSAGDYAATTCALVANALPGFFTGMVAIYIFSVKLKWLPMSGMYTSSATATVWEVLRHLILPASCLAIQQLGSVMRHVRSNMLDILSEDYVRTARAKGLAEKRVVGLHALRNSMIPIVTLFSTSIPFLIGGAVVTESIFSWPGLGSLMVTSIQGRDYPVIMGISVVIAIAVLVGNLLVDLIYGLLDPRVRYE